MKNDNLREEIDFFTEKSTHTIRNSLKRKMAELEKQLKALNKEYPEDIPTIQLLPTSHRSKGCTDPNFIGTTGGREYVEKIAEKCRMVLRKMATENLVSKHEIPNTVQQVFDVLIEAWSHEFPGRRFAILCIQSGIPWTGLRNTVQLYTWKHLYMRHITGGLQPPSLPHYPRQNIKTKLGEYDCHVVEITKNTQVGDKLGEIDDFSRGKDVFLYGVDDLYRI